ncbi:MAG TPA: hypothetical protein VFB72_09140 [Verrucomicrobiae bacterium]|nr:hypothetical protein [Verrucomicrobiae bacterium]
MNLKATISLINKAIVELETIHRLNAAADIEIKKLQTSTRKKLDRIRKNMRAVEAAKNQPYT